MFKNKKIAVLGLGIENYALLNYLFKNKSGCEITIFDRRNKEKLGDKYKELKTRVEWRFGHAYRKNLSSFDIMFRSPGWPLDCPYLTKARDSGIKLTSPMQLFFKLSPTKNIIGVTGTKGKGTTASLIYHILKQSGKKSWLGGNIGIAPFDFIDKLGINDWVVLELSSFQLEDMTVSPGIAVITNFTKEHLAAADPNNPNYHKSISDYRAAKLNIIKFQKENDLAIINQKLEIRNWKLGKGRKIIFTKSDLPSRLVGEHNQENVAAAAAVARAIGINEAVIKKSVASFKGLEHRLEQVRALKGVKYYNDSFATTPEATITALKSFSAPIILLAGGAEKQSDFKELAREVKKRVKYTILLEGKATSRLKGELKKSKYPVDNIKLAKDMKTAVSLAAGQADSGDTVLLSTACASFGMFKNYKERGELFKQEVMLIR
jgi:UDP-N-acetylmuramoylalanine--D-glutamate ligase